MHVRVCMGEGGGAFVMRKNIPDTWRVRVQFLFTCRAGVEKHTSSVPAEWDGAQQRTWLAASVDRGSDCPSAGRYGSSDSATSSPLCCLKTAAQSSPLQWSLTSDKPISEKEKEEAVSYTSAFRQMRFKRGTQLQSGQLLHTEKF